MMIEPLNENIGVMIHGIQLAAISDSVFDAIYSAFLKHQVLFFRDQQLTPKEHLRLASRFGELEPVHPFFPHIPETPQVTVIETSRGKPPGKSTWHTDLTWQEKPAKCSVLHAQHVPPSGGDTLWVSMQAVWAALPETLRETLRPLKAVHSVHAVSGSRYDKMDNQGKPLIDKLLIENPPVVHPIVKAHPETGLETLFINEQFTQCIEGISQADSDELLQSLFEVARQKTWQVRFQWEPYSIAIWDNRNTQHRAVTDYGDTPRRLHRVTVKGE